MAFSKNTTTIPQSGSGARALEYVPEWNSGLTMDSVQYFCYY